MQQVLFVCTGNTCRSPMAEVIANDYFKKSRLNYNAISRGINVLVPSRASENAIKALQLLYKLNLTNHISRQISAEDIKNASVVLTMTNSQKEYLQLVYGEDALKIDSIYSYIGNYKKSIKDPYDRDIVYYKECAEELHRVIIQAFN